VPDGVMLGVSVCVKVDENVAVEDGVMLGVPVCRLDDDTPRLFVGVSVSVLDDDTPRLSVGDKLILLLGVPVCVKLAVSVLLTLICLVVVIDILGYTRLVGVNVIVREGVIVLVAKTPSNPTTMDTTLITLRYDN